MIKNVLTSIGGVEAYGIISICLFFIVFTTAMVWSMTLKKPFLKEMGSLPLDEPNDSKKQEDSHE